MVLTARPTLLDRTQPCSPFSPYLVDLVDELSIGKQYLMCMLGLGIHGIPAQNPTFLHRHQRLYLLTFYSKVAGSCATSAGRKPSAFPGLGKCFGFSFSCKGLSYDTVYPSLYSVGTVYLLTMLA